MRIAIYAGTFDPITCGHLSVIERGARMFDRLVVAIAENSRKSSLFTVEERLDGTLHITYHGHELRYRAIPARPLKAPPAPPGRLSTQHPGIPPADHPWRKPFRPKRRLRDQSLAAP